MANEVIQFNKSNIVVKDFVDKFNDMTYQAKQELPVEMGYVAG